MVGTNRAEVLTGRLELCHDISREGQQWYENHANTAIKDTEHADDMTLAESGAVDC